MTRSTKRITALLLTTAVLAAAAGAALTNYQPAAAENSVSFRARSTGHDFEGKTATVEGQFGCDREKIAETAYGEIRIPVGTLATGISARDREMRGTFEADRNPFIVFKLKNLSNLVWTGSDTFTATAAGDLTMHGVTREARFEITSAFIGERLSVSGSCPLKITSFGMKPPGFLIFKVADDVRVSFRLVGRASRPR